MREVGSGKLGVGSWKFTENRELTTDNRQKDVGSGKWEVGSEPRTENRQPTTDNRQPRTNSNVKFLPKLKT